MRVVFLVFSLILTVAAEFSVLHSLKLFNQTTPTSIPKVLDGSKIYLSSKDKAAALARITLSSNGMSITLNKLLNSYDLQGYQEGWPVNSDLAISTTNSQNVTNGLMGSLFIVTPTMAQDPNFLVCVVVGSKHLDRSQNDNSTIVLLNVHTANNGTPPYMGFTHSRVENIVQPRATSLSFFSGEPSDNYADLSNGDTLSRRIFSNPLQVTTEDDGVAYFFDNIDPIQYARPVWVVSARGGIALDVSDTYVDTTNIQSNKATVTGLANSQLMTYNSSVTFLSSGNNMGFSGIMVFSELFGNENITILINGKDSKMLTFLEQNTHDANTGVSVEWPAENMQFYPSGSFIGIYSIQYFKTDNGPAPTTSGPTTVTTTVATSVSTVAPNNPTTAPSSSTNGVPSSVPTSSPKFSSTEAIQTTTKSVATSLIALPILLAVLHSLLRV